MYGLAAATSGAGSEMPIFRWSRIAERGAQFRAEVIDSDRLAELPAPVQRYFAFTFRDSPTNHSVVRVEAAGDFRRPLTDTFNHTTAEQILAIGTPALMFSATTPIFPGIWARAYDFYAAGEMEMKAKLLSVVTVMDQAGTPELNQISLRRWLLESALFPQALLPGGVVSWEPIDDGSARAIARSDGLSASLVAHFAKDGRMTYMVAEEDGDLTTPYHGSGEHVSRDDYQWVGQQRIPMSFTISRSANGELHPFFKARITSIEFQ